MGNLVVDIGNTNNWELHYTVSLTAVPVGNNRYIPIPRQEVPILFDKNIIAVLATSDTVRAYAGFIGQKFRTGITAGNAPNAESFASHRLYKNRLGIFTFDPLAATYSLVLGPPFWAQDMKYTVWQYIGPQGDTTENLITVLQSTVDDIQSSIQNRP